jgi:crotonobetainyl-CoA:carnitine CoA-transferase CaiB-like acyl-CoA transferase
VSTRHQHNHELAAGITQAIEKQDWSHWKATFAENGVTCGGVAKAADQLDDAQVSAAGLLSEFAGNGGRTVDSPMFVTGAEKRQPTVAPEVGEHSTSVLSELGVDADTVESLRSRGIISGRISRLLS